MGFNPLSMVLLLDNLISCHLLSEIDWRCSVGQGGHEYHQGDFGHLTRMFPFTITCMRGCNFCTCSLHNQFTLKLSKNHK